MPNLNGLYIFGDFMSGYVLQFSKIYLHTFKQKKYNLNVDAPKILGKKKEFFFPNCRGSVSRGFDVLANALLC